MPISELEVHPPRWAKKSDPLGVGRAPRCRTSGRLERYFPADPRVTVDSCQHTQFLDIDLARGLVRCLDCGAVVDVTKNWVVDPSSPALTDAQLLQARMVFNDFNWDKAYKPTPGHPDIAEKDAQIARDLAAQGIERIDPDHVRELAGS